MIYKGNDNYYLEAVSPSGGNRPAGVIDRRQLRRGVRHRPSSPANTWAHLAETYDGANAAPLRQRHPGREPRPHRQHRHLHQPAADRRRQHLRPVLQRPDRRGPHLQHRPDRRPDPNRHGDTGRRSIRRRHDRRRRSRRAERDGGRHQRDQPVLDRLDRQRRRHRLPDRALPGRRLHQLHPDRDQHDGTSYNDTGLTAGNTYSYRVRATDASSNLSPYSNTATATTPAADGQPPTAPSNLTATAGQRRRDRPRLDRAHRQRLRQRLPHRTLPRRRLQHLQPDRHHQRHHHHLQRHHPHPRHQLQLPRPRHRPLRQPNPLLQHRHQHHPRRQPPANRARRR